MVSEFLLDPGWDFCPVKGFLSLKCFIALSFLIQKDCVDVIVERTATQKWLFDAYFIDSEIFRDDWKTKIQALDSIENILVTIKIKCIFKSFTMHTF